MMNLELKASRRALADAKKAAELFRRGDLDFQLVWVLNAAFLGIIPDVLQTVDKNKCPEARKYIGEILREYENNTRGPKEIRNWIMHQYEELYEGIDVYTVGVYKPGVYESRRIRRGTSKGRHPAHVIEESIQMWDTILDKIEHRLRTKS